MSVGLVRLASQPQGWIWRIAFLAAILSSVASAGAQKPAAEKNVDQPKLLSELQSAKWTERASAVYALLGIPANQLTAQVKHQILHLYAAELSKWREASQGQLPEAELRTRSQETYAEYFGYLGTLVMRVGGRQALRLLIESPSAPMADSNQELAAQGIRVLPMVLNRLGALETFRIEAGSYLGPDVESQMAMADILGQMLALDQAGKLQPSMTKGDYREIRLALRPLLSSSNDYVRLYGAVALARAHDIADTKNIKEAFARLLSSPIPGTRSAGLNKLASLKDPRFAPLNRVRQLAISDPYHYTETEPGGSTEQVYPVRRDALKALDEFSRSPFRDR